MGCVGVGCMCVVCMVCVVVGVCGCVECGCVEWVCVDTGDVFIVGYAHCYKYRTLFTEQCCTEVKVQHLCIKVLTFLPRFPDSVSHT